MSIIDSAKVAKDFEPKLVAIFAEFNNVLKSHGIPMKIQEVRLSSGGAEALLNSAHANKVKCAPCCVASGDDGVTCGICCKWSGNP